MRLIIIVRVTLVMFMSHPCHVLSITRFVNLVISHPCYVTGCDRTRLMQLVAEHWSSWSTTSNDSVCIYIRAHTRTRTRTRTHTHTRTRTHTHTHTHTHTRTPALKGLCSWRSLSTASLMVPSTWRNFCLYSSSYNGSAVWRKRETERQREVGRKEEAGKPVED